MNDEYRHYETDEDRVDELEAKLAHANEALQFCHDHHTTWATPADVVDAEIRRRVAAMTDEESRQVWSDVQQVWSKLVSIEEGWPALTRALRAALLRALGVNNA